MDEMFEPKKKERLDKDFFKGFIFIFVLGLFLVVGTSYSLEFFKVNKNGASIQFSTSAISINVTGDNTVNNTLSKYIDSEGLLNGLTKELTITNTNANHGEAILKIERTSGVELSNIHYALVINNIVQKVDTVPSDGIIFDNVIMGNETLNVKVVLWVDNDYSGSDLTFNGTISSEIKRTYNLTSDILDDVIDFNNITTATNNYVSFNNEVYRIVKIEDDRIVICKNSDFDSTAASRVNSNKFNSSLTYADNSIIYSHSTDNKNLYLVKTVNIKSGKGTSTDPIIFKNNRGYLNDKKVSNYITYKDDNNTILFTQPVYYGETNYIMYAYNDPNFQGWNDGTNDYSLGDSITLTGDKVLTAVVQQTAYSNLARLAQVKNDINFGNISSDTNGKGLYVLKGTENDTNPIYYYRGKVDNNNVIFGGFCWQIVRTTNTGGIKMIYNGVVTGYGKTCENTAANDRQLANTTAFNTTYQSMSDVGYMYNKRYAYSTTTPTEGAYFGSGVNYDDTTNMYTLTGADVTTPDASHHYSCDLTDPAGSCATVRYYYYVSGSSYYHIKLTDGEKIEDAIYKMTGNGTDEVKNREINQNYKLNNTDSTIKTYIESWFKTNLTNEEDATKINYQEYLEDTVYCNDRRFQENGSNTLLKSGWNPNVDNTEGFGGLTTYIYFNTRTRFNNNSWYSTTNKPTFACPNETDSFSVSNEKAKLKYPVGLLTADEIILAGAAGNSYTNNTSYYLYTGNYYWGLSPSYFSNVRNAYGFLVDSSGNLHLSYVRDTVGARPAVSLASGTEFENGGDGTKNNPYVVKYRS